ncbi:glycoside hydrolase family 10 protein [Nemorincola caseinilytica]|uniref:glycoside hydrolase family 10 protein n=1 Tax=Nemorincola caseinilytica TaxID=2054315 RepID=UPI0031E68CDB
MVRFSSLLAAFCLLFHIGSAQSPKREFRAAWIASVANIDWPSKPGLAAVEQQQQFIRQLDMLRSVGCNAVIVQIRPVSDALYASKKEPWSHYLTGRQGEPPFPYYDPLIFMIEEAHKRNMEFHAWFNPFRALMDSKKNPNPQTHVTHTHKDWIIAYGGKSYVDPGIPEAREYVIDVIMDVVKRYDIDAVHLDDYFYPYRVPGQQFADTKSYARYGKGTDKEDWRRDNVSRFISLLNTSIKNEKPWMKLGISPFGVWRNKSKDPEGSDTRGGQTTYDDLYADVLMWLQKGWVDYMMPQLYWEHDHKAAPFSVLQPWWYEHCYKRHVYYGLGLYRMTTAKSGPWASANELLWQLRDIRQRCPNSGYSFYSSSCFEKIKAPIMDSLREGHSKYPALVPPMPWLDDKAPAAPVVKNTGNMLEWQVPGHDKERLRYVVYRFGANEQVDLERTDRILSIQQERTYKVTESRKSAIYVVTALDRLSNESEASNTIKL